MVKVDNAIIMAAGTSSRFAPISYELPKALITVKGEVLIERQIKQLKAAGIKQIVVVTGYKAEKFAYLAEKFDVILVHNPDYLTRNNNSSINAVRDYLHNSYVCSADNYFVSNPFEAEVDDSYYAAEYSSEYTKEWCLTEDAAGYIASVKIGSSQAWYMIGHTFWSNDFSQKFLSIMDSIYDQSATADLLWEDIYIQHLDVLKMKIRKYPPQTILEFDTLDELRQFDHSYVADTRSTILKAIAQKLSIPESEIVKIKTLKSVTNEAIGFTFLIKQTEQQYQYLYDTQGLTAIGD
mgnify:CR=1 FL=1